jgi:cyclase
MLKNRVIPILLHSENGLVKTTQFKDPVYVGDPLNTVRIFNSKSVDELIFLDIERTRLDMKPNFKLASRIATECFMPLGFGGGIKNFSDARTLLSIGIEKLVLQSAAIYNPQLISQIANFSGRQSVSVAIDVLRIGRSDYKVFDATNRKVITKSLIEVVQNVQEMGAGEIILTSVKNEGCMKGYDIDLIRTIRPLVKVPIVANGGAGCIQDFVDAIKVGADAVAAGSLFVFYSSRKGVLINYPDSFELEAQLGRLDD